MLELSNFSENFPLSRFFFTSVSFSLIDEYIMCWFSRVKLKAISNLKEIIFAMNERESLADFMNIV